MQGISFVYGYTVKALNQQVKRNIKRFPDDFMFRTSKEEVNHIKEQIKYQESQGIVSRSQFVTLLKKVMRLKEEYRDTSLIINMIEYAREHQICCIDLAAMDEGYSIYK